MRGVAIIMVIMCHSHPYFAKIADYHLPGYVNYILMNGDKGVTLFFLMSAFTLCLSLTVKKEYERRPVTNYFIRRFFRIAPLYYLIILLSYALNVTAGSVGSVFANLFFIHGMSPYWINAVVPGGWSVGIEVLFYLIFPLLYFKIKTLSGAINVTLVAILAAKVVTSLMFKAFQINDASLWGIYIYENFASQLPVFLIGICLFHIQHRKPSAEERSRFKLSYCFIALLVILHLSATTIFKSHYIYGIAFALLAFLVSRFHPGWIVNRFLAGVGKISYSLYLVHIIIANLLIKFDLTHYSSNSILDVVIRFLIISTISLLFSFGTYKLVEIPFQRFGRNLIRKLEGTQRLKLVDLPAENSVNN